LFGETTILLLTCPNKPIDFMITLCYYVFVSTQIGQDARTQGRLLVEKQKTITRTIRISKEVDERIKVLASKRLCSINAWIAHTLEREVQPK
jgi:uncharacterized OsmC-like protein